MSKAAVKRFWAHLTEMGCCVCGGPAEVAHAAGKPSVVERIQEPKAKGKKLPRMDWLCIPLCPQHHRLDRFSLDTAPEHFETLHGPVAKHLDRIGKKLGLDLWKLSQIGRKS